MNVIRKIDFPTTKVNEIPITTYPNPFVDIVNIEFQITQKGKVRADIYDINGRYLQNILSETLDAERYIRQIDLSNLPNGNYFIIMKSETEQGTFYIQKIK